MKPNESPKEHNRGWHFPIALVALYEAKAINAEQMMLLGKVDALQDPEKGCYASNEWLGRWWGKTGSWVSKTLTHLQSVGVIRMVMIQKGKHTERQIWVTYQGDHLTPGQKSATPLAEKCYPPSRKVLPSNDTSYHTSKAHCGGKDSLRSSKVPSTDGFFGKEGEESPFISKAVTKLENHIRQERKLDRRINRKHWYDQLRLLLQDLGGDRVRFKQIMVAFLKAPVDKFKPQVECAASFRSKFAKIESWVTKHHPLPPKEEIDFKITSHRTV